MRVAEQDYFAETGSPNGRLQASQITAYCWFRYLQLGQLHIPEGFLRERPSRNRAQKAITPTQANPATIDQKCASESGAMRMKIGAIQTAKTYPPIASA